GKTRIAHFHLFAFDIAREPSDEHDDVRRARRFERFFERRFRSGQAPAEPHLGIADVIEVLEPQVVGPTGLEIHERALACDARRELPTVEHELAVDEQTEAVIRAHRKLVAARDRGHELSGPPNAEVVAAYRIRREFATRD